MSSQGNGPSTYSMTWTQQRCHEELGCVGLDVALPRYKIKAADHSLPRLGWSADAHLFLSVEAAVLNVLRAVRERQVPDHLQYAHLHPPAGITHTVQHGSCTMWKAGRTMRRLAIFSTGLWLASSCSRWSLCFCASFLP